MSLRLHQDLFQTQALDKPGAHCTRLDWTVQCIQFDQTVNLINQSRLGQQGKSKEEQVSKEKQIEPDDAKQKLMYQNRQDSAKQRRTIQQTQETDSSEQAERCECTSLPQVTKSLNQILHKRLHFQEIRVATVCACGALSVRSHMCLCGMIRLLEAML